MMVADMETAFRKPVPPLMRRIGGLKQAEIARLADIDPSTLSRMLRGERNPSVDSAKRVAEALSRLLNARVSVDELLQAIGQ